MISLQKSDKKFLLKIIIEHLRKELIHHGIQEGLTSEKAIHISQKLDTYILKYQRIHKN